MYYDAPICWRERHDAWSDEQSGHLFSYLSPEQRVPVVHPLRTIRAMTDDVLRRLSPRFDAIYAATGRPSIPPEHLLRTLLLQVLYSVRSERMLMEQLEYNLLFRWFVRLGMDDDVWAPTTFTNNRDRLLEGDIAGPFFEDVVAQARGRRLLSAEHFTIDGTLREAWAGQKSFRRKDQPGGPPDDPGNPTVNFLGERRSNQTHQSTTDPDSRLFKKAKGDEAKLAHLSEVLMENRHGLVVRRVRSAGDWDRRTRYGDEPHRWPSAPTASLLRSLSVPRRLRRSLLTPAGTPWWEIVSPITSTSPRTQTG